MKEIFSWLFCEKKGMVIIMSVNAIVGANWGDEGKGKMTDYLAQKSDIVVRFQGGNNAGHTIINNYGKFALHLIPSGVFYSHVTNVLGPGVALNISAFLKELEELNSKGVPSPNILISDRAQVLLPYHILFDQYEEERLGKEQFGSTKSGIAPFFSDKYAKTGIQVSDLFNQEALSFKLNKILEVKNILLKHLYNKPEINIEDFLPKLLSDAEKIKPLICDTTAYLNNAIDNRKNILLEGQLGALRDPDHGIYPYSTSSSTLAGFACVGAGIPPFYIKNITAVVKAYSSCVGAGPFVTEILNNNAQELRDKGGDCGEYGATTGRPRRMGWFDAVATKYGCRLQGTTEIALTLLDVLSYLDEIPVCTSYNIAGNVTDDFPVTSKLYTAKPVYTILRGWKKDISNVRNFNDLPAEAKNYVVFIEKQLGVPVKWISVGSSREATFAK